MTVRIHPQDFIHIDLEPLLGGRQLLDIVVHRCLSTEERDLVVILHTERISSVDVVSMPNCEIRAFLVGGFTNGSDFEDNQLLMTSKPLCAGFRLSFRWVPRLMSP